MAEKITLSDDNHYGPGSFDLAASPHKNNWTDGLPHDFKGWGPRTPDPQEPEAQSAPTPRDELTWHGDDEHHHNHYVWHFDGRRHRHH